MHQPSFLRTVATKAGYFVFHFAEMWFAMFVGMAVFMMLSIALRALGYAGVVDASSIEFQVGMGAFMVAPMSVWMRIRGCSWPECAEMSAAMLTPTAAAVVMRAFELRDMLAWFARNEHAFMLVAMLALMLYRREHYTSGYSFGRLAGVSRRQQKANAWTHSSVHTASRIAMPDARARPQSRAPTDHRERTSRGWKCMSPASVSTVTRR